jgi:hypothetical protein
MERARATLTSSARSSSRRSSLGSLCAAEAWPRRGTQLRRDLFMRCSRRCLCWPGEFERCLLVDARPPGFLDEDTGLPVALRLEVKQRVADAFPGT